MSPAKSDAQKRRRQHAQQQPGRDRPGHAAEPVQHRDGRHQEHDARPAGRPDRARAIPRPMPSDPARQAPAAPVAHWRQRASRIAMLAGIRNREVGPWRQRDRARHHRGHRRRRDHAGSIVLDPFLDLHLIDRTRRHGRQRLARPGPPPNRRRTEVAGGRSRRGRLATAGRPSRGGRSRGHRSGSPDPSPGDRTA